MFHFEQIFLSVKIKNETNNEKDIIYSRFGCVGLGIV